MADGVTIQRASFAALQGGFTLPWLLGELEQMQPRPQAPLLLMSYLNPLLAFGLDRLPEAAARAGVAGFIIPDLPYEESADVRAALDRVGHRAGADGHAGDAAERAADAVRGEPGLRLRGDDDRHDRQVRRRCRTTCSTTWTACAPCRRCRCAPASASAAREQVARMQGHVDGVVVGSALVEVLERGEDPARSSFTAPVAAAAGGQAGRLVHDVRALRLLRLVARRTIRATPMPRATAGAEIGRRGWTLVYGGGRVGLMGVARRRGARCRRAGSSASSRGSSTSAKSAHDGLTLARDRAIVRRAQAAHGRAVRRVPVAARRRRHDGRAVRGLELDAGPAAAQAERVAERRRLLRRRWSRSSTDATRERLHQAAVTATCSRCPTRRRRTAGPASRRRSRQACRACSAATTARA